MYFSSPGSQNSARTAELAIEAARKHKIRDIVIATSTGETAKYFEGNEDLNIVCITYSYGFFSPGENVMSDGKRKELEDKGFKVYTATHVLAGAERAFVKQFGGMYPVETIAKTLYMFGKGVKVCVEIATMAADGGLIPPDVPIIAVGGTSRGCDTAVIMRAAHANNIFNTKIDEIICKPYV